ncbi:fermitin family homolog 3-like isoform X2 [Athene noctua]|uniref:fermitin family homolog 3-like isoform X2 n=1 Tax=Athene noctua TaxID=126797 RepID=UPI003EBAFE59
MAGLKTASGEAIDGSFELQVEVEEGDAAGGQPAAPRALALRVTGDLHVGGLMLLIVETVGVQRDWSDHALWWAQRRQWLLRPGRTLDALGVGGDARLRFTPQHRPLRLRLPNRRRLRLRLSFAQPLAHGVAQACRLLGIRHPEELSLLRPPEEEEEGGEGRKGKAVPPPPDFDLSHLLLPAGEEGPRTEPLPHLPPGCYRTLVAPRGGLGPVAPPRPPRGSPLLRRTRLHARWLESSRSLMEQDVADDEELLLRFKYHCVLDLDPQRDELRLALLYEQARWALLTEEIDCTEEEMMLFAALQEELTTIPELAEELEIYRPRKLTLRGFRPTWAVLKEMSLSYGRSPPAPGEPLQQFNLRGCEVTPDVDVGAQKFCIKLLVAAPEGMSEIHLRCRDAPQYARWVAGCRLASRGRSLADASFEAEARGVLGVLGLQPGGAPSLPPTAPGAPQRPPPDPRVLLAPRFQRKVKAKQLVPRILEVLHRVGALSPAQARLRFVDAWRALPGFGLAYFLVRFKGGRRDEVLGVGPSRLLRLDPGTSSVTRTWRYSALRQWNINWDTQQVTLELEGEVTLALWVLSAPCQVLHEFLGGYLCLGGRQPGQPLDLNLFHKLTGGQEPL